jgi:dihydrofolate reductase
MRKIIVGAQVSMDGVMQAPGGPTEDATKGFKFGGWSMPYFDEAFGEEIDRLFKEKFDLLLGRKTYEILPRTGHTIKKTPPLATSPSCSTTSRST